MLQLIGAFFSGIFLFNAVPHLVRGICGQRHMTPFARSSSPTLNVIWAWINLIIGGVILKASHLLTWSFFDWLAFVVGGVIISVYLAVFWSNPEARLPWHKE